MKILFDSHDNIRVGRLMMAEVTYVLLLYLGYYRAIFLIHTIVFGSKMKLLIVSFFFGRNFFGSSSIACSDLRALLIAKFTWYFQFNTFAIEVDPLKLLSYYVFLFLARLFYCKLCPFCEKYKFMFLFVYF